MIITINGKACECEKGEFLLQIARRNGIEIPTLCHHDGLPGQGACRLCIVEVFERGKGKIVVSCVYPVEHECEVFTDNEKVRRQRGMILRLLQSRAPESKEIAALCVKYDAPVIDRFIKVEGSKCVLCGLCAKACSKLSVGAISTVNRGVTKEVSTPYYEPSPVCIGCGSCANVCPTGAITMVDANGKRTIWGREFDLVTCTECGEVIGTKEMRQHAGAKDCLCDNCRRVKTVSLLSRVIQKDQ